MKIKNLIFGSPIPNAKQQEQKIGLFASFAILFSNSLYSVSYAIPGEVFIYFGKNWRSSYYAILN